MLSTITLESEHRNIRTNTIKKTYCMFSKLNVLYQTCFKHDVNAIKIQMDTIVSKATTSKALV